MYFSGMLIDTNDSFVQLQIQNQNFSEWSTSGRWLEGFFQHTDILESLAATALTPRNLWTCSYSLIPFSPCEGPSRWSTRTLFAQDPASRDSLLPELLFTNLLYIYAKF